MSDLIRIGAHAVHYLSIFDGQGRALWLGRAKRLASADQRIVLIARDRGCTRPGCEANAYDCQAHHLDPFGKDGQTDVDELGQACGPDNRMADQYGWTTLLNAAGRVEWHPPPALDRGQARINATHFPEDLLAALRRRRAEQHGPPEPGPPLGPYSPVRPGEDPPGTAPSWFDDAVDTAGWGAYFDETDAELDELAVNHPEDACDDCPDLTDAEFEDLVRRDPERRYPPAC